MSEFLWGTYPYICIVLFFAVPIIRMITRPYSWSTRASGMFGRRLLGLASVLMHWGLALLLFGHLIALFGGLLGSGGAIAVFYWMGLFGGFLVLIGSVLALYRRITSAEVRAMSQSDDYIIHFFLIGIVGLALYQVLVHQIFGVAYTASSWTASLWTLSPQPELMASASLISKLHILLALTFFGYFPFTKLVHFWTFPVNYFFRPYQSMRTAKNRFRKKWEFAFRSDKSWLAYGLGTVAMIFLASGFTLGGPESTGETSVEWSPSGKLMGVGLYRSQCARCHGTAGRGDGPGAKSSTFSTQPRDLVTAKYHFVTTENLIASDDDLHRTIRNGLGGSGMPAYAEFSGAQIDSLVAVLNGFRAENGEQPGAALVVPPRPAATPASVAKGGELYQMNCASCHGAGGRGDGLGQSYDYLANRIMPRNLAAGEFKVGRSSEDLYTRVTLGVPGGAGAQIMMGFSHLSDEQRWSIVHYLEQEIIPPTGD